MGCEFAFFTFTHVKMNAPLTDKCYLLIFNIYAYKLLFLIYIITIYIGTLLNLYLKWKKSIFEQMKKSLKK
jgi:hypothetical protein